MTALAILMIGGGFFMMYEAYKAINANNTSGAVTNAAAPVTKLKTSL